MRANPERLLGPAARQRCYEVAEDIVETIRTYGGTPELTHLMDNSYRAVRTEDGAAIVNPTDYWRFQEFGTSEMTANPHVRPSIEIVRMRRLR